MRIEGQSHRSSARSARVITRLADHALVAEVHSVEDSDGQVDIAGDRNEFLK